MARTTPSGTTDRADVVMESKPTQFGRALEYLDARVNLERSRRRERSDFKLDRMHALLRELGDPHHDFPAVQIAGSKGKGSVAEMTTAALGSCGYAAGVYTSPHLVDVRERIRINDRVIDETEFAVQTARVQEASRRLDLDPSYFEVLTAVAFLHFAEQAVDVAIVECGLGGRLDSTTVLNPVVCAIAEIQLEHTDVLGSTLEQIAAEKAGIFKGGSMAISVPQKPEVRDVLLRFAEEVGSTLEFVGEEIDYSFRFEASPELGPHVRICVSTDATEFEHIPVPLKGQHQAMNCALSLSILDRLRRRGFETPARDVAEGLARTPSHGRLELIHDRPRVLIDGAHNPDSINAMIRAIGAHIRYDSMVVIFGCARDKDIDGMLQGVALGADKVIFSKATANPRAAEPEDLQRRFATMSTKMSQIEPDLRQAINTAARAVGQGDLILVTGSFHLAGEAKHMILSRHGKKHV